MPAKMLLSALIVTPLFAQNGATVAPASKDPAPAYKFITPQQRFVYFASKTAGPASLGQDAVSAAIQTWRNSPHEWRPTWEGFGKRMGSRVARSGIGSGIELGVSAMLKEDPRFFRSHASGGGTRFRHAVAWTFLAHKPDGGTTPAIGRIAGKVGSSFIVNQWYPPSSNKTSDALSRIGTSFGFSAAFNIVKEFSPELRRPFKKKK